MAQETSSMGLGDVLGILRRRRQPMVITAATVALIALLAAVFWPPTYLAQGTILIEQQELPADLVRSTISSYADQRIQMITQRVMTTENLMQIIKRYDLYADRLKVEPREKVIKRMQDDIGFKMISADVIDPRSGNPTKATIAFTVSYKNRNAELSAKVANELVSLYLQQNIENRKQRSSDAATFLNDESERLSKTIGELQARIAEFKGKHINDLPELTQLNIQQLNRMEEESREVDTRVRSLDQQVTYLQAQLAQISPTSQVYTSTGERVLSPNDRLKFLQTEYARVSGLYSEDHPDVIRIKREIEGLQQAQGDTNAANDLERQLTDAKVKLLEAQQKYSPEHPDVQRLNRQVAALQSQLTSATTRSSTPKSLTEPDNPAYIQIKAQLESSLNERVSLLQKRAQLKSQIAEQERRLRQTPAVERDYMEMSRELDNNQLKYREVRQKQMEAQVSQNLETERKGERFTIIEPPLTPEQPNSPNRMLILIAGVLLSLGGAVGIALLKEQTDQSVRHRKDLLDMLKVPPLAIIPWMPTAEEIAAHQRRVRYAVAGTVSTVIIGLGLIHVFYRPLDVLWQIALRRMS